MPASTFDITLPRWLDSEFLRAYRVVGDLGARMELAIRLAERNVEEGSGGPFGAAVFGEATGELVSVGVNLVVGASLSIAHAEIVALSLAQVECRTFDLGTITGGLQLVTSAEPCAMCLGAILWSGVTAVAAGARDQDVRAVGFDEGPKPADWTEALRARGVRAASDVQRDRAVAVLRLYRQRGGRIYNASSLPDPPPQT